MNSKIKKRQPRLREREFELKKELVVYCWKKYKKEYNMEEMARVFRMPLAQFYSIVKTHEESKKKSKV